MDKDVIFEEEPEVINTPKWQTIQPAMTHWLLKKNIVKSEKQATIFLLFVIFLSLLLSIVIIMSFVFHVGKTPETKSVIPTEMLQQLKQGI